MTPEENKRIVDDAIAHSKFRPTPAKGDDVTEVMTRATEAMEAISKQMVAIEEARRNGSNLPFDLQTFSQTASKLFLEEFRQWSKDELLLLMVIIHVQKITEDLV